MTRVRTFAALALLVSLAACGGSPSRHAAHHPYNPSRYYPPPGPASDPWGPYVREASGRFGVPELWIRRVMRQESGGQEDVISWAGAMGLMQVMPDTYDELRSRYSLGEDPYDPHNNILAGTAYLREMYDRYGAPGFLAAYNAGPNRLDRYLNEGKPLPLETVNYVASIAPQLGPGTPMSGPLAVYGGGAARFASSGTAAGCDPDAAYDPDHPCRPVPQPAAAQQVAYAQAPAYVPRAAPAPSQQPYAAAARGNQSGPCDPDAAYDPAHPCQAPAPQRAKAVSELPLAAPSQRQAPVQTASAGYGGRPIQEAMGEKAAFGGGFPPTGPFHPTSTGFGAAPPAAAAHTGDWAIQVGAFANLNAAQTAAETARSAAPDLLRTAKAELPATTPLGSQVAFRARLFGLTRSAATEACSRLGVRGIACMTVPPDRTF